MSDRIKVEVYKNVHLDIPIHVDEKTTREIAQDLYQRIAAIAEQARIINTQQWALQAAFECLAEMRERDEADQQDTAALLRVLDQIHTRLETLADDVEADAAQD